MRLCSIYLIACLFISSVVSLHPYWRLAWRDEFDTLDRTKWNLRNQDGNYGNGEKQWYSPDQISVANGFLTITAEKKNFAGRQYVSGRMDTQDKAAFSYGRHEVRAKMAGGKGIWPAMWLLSQDKCWAFGAEIDLAEFRGSFPNRIGNYYHYASTCCESFANCISSKGKETTLNVDLTQGYYTYAVEWWSTNMTWLINDYVIYSYQTSSLSVTQDVSPHFWVINNAIGGGYPGDPDSTTPFPNYHSVDYVRSYVYRRSCSGVTCSNKGCCNPTTVLCQCNAGYSGANCEYNLGNAVNKFDSVTNLDIRPHGWGNDYTTFLYSNAAASNGVLKFTISNAGCPGSCGGKPYSSGAWEGLSRYGYGTFAFTAKCSKVPGTGFSLTAAGEQTGLEQVAFTFMGANTSYVSLWTWTNNWGYKHADIALGFDASAAYHTYSFIYAADSIRWFIDGTQKLVTTEVMPVATRLGPGAYYTAQPVWYGPFSYTGTSSAYIDQFSWTVTPKLATC